MDALPRLILSALSWPRLGDNQGHKVPCNWLVDPKQQEKLLETGDDGNLELAIVFSSQLAKWEMHMGVHWDPALESWDEGCRAGCACPSGEGSRDCCWACWEWHGAGPPGVLGTQTARSLGCGHALSPSETLEELASSRAEGRAMCP